MTDEVTAPLLYNSENLNKIRQEKKEENKKTNIKKDIPKKQDIINNEVVPVLNVGEENRISICEWIIDKINFHFFYHYKEKMGSTFLIYSFEMIIFHLMLYYSFDKFNIRLLYLNLLFALSIIFSSLLSILHIYIYDSLRDLSFLILFLLAIISTFNTYFFIYRLSIILTYEFIRNIMFTFIIINLSIFFSFYFGSGGNAELNGMAFIVSSLISAIICFGMFFLGIVKIKYSFIIWYVDLIFLLISLLHGEHLFTKFVRRNKLNDYPLIYICLHIDLFLLGLYFFWTLIELIIKKLIKYIKENI